MQASAQTSLCRLYADMHAHAHTRHMRLIIHLWLKASAMDTTAVPCTHLFISLYLLGPTDNTDLPTSPQMRPFPPNRKAENVHTVCHVLLSQFFSLSWESSQVSTNQTRGSLNLMNSSQSMFSEAFWTPNTASLHVREVKVRPIKSELSSPNFFQVRRTPWTRFAKQKFVQLRTGLTVI